MSCSWHFKTWYYHGCSSYQDCLGDLVDKKIDIFNTCKHAAQYIELRIWSICCIYWIKNLKHVVSDFRDKRVCLQGVAAIFLPGPLARASQALVPPHWLPMQLAMQLPIQLLGSSQTWVHIQLLWQEVADFRPHQERSMSTAPSGPQGMLMY